MSKIYISYFLLLTYLSLLIFKYLCEKTIIEKFQELPQIDGNDLRLLSRLAHSFVKGEPFKVLNTFVAPNFFIGNRKLNLADIQVGGGKGGSQLKLWQNPELLEKQWILGPANNPMRFDVAREG